MLRNSEVDVNDQKFGTFLIIKWYGQDKKLFGFGHVGSYRSHDWALPIQPQNMVTEISPWESFQEIWKLMNFWKTLKYSTENSGRRVQETEVPGK